MELGCDGVLLNTAIAGAQNPVLMAAAMRQAVKAVGLRILLAACLNLIRPLPVHPQKELLTLEIYKKLCQSKVKTLC